MDLSVLFELLSTVNIEILGWLDSFSCLHPLFQLAMPTDDYAKDLLGRWQKAVKGNISWVLFKNGSVVFVKEVKKSVEEDAIDIMKTEGPVFPGSEHGDFNIQPHPEIGWIVTCHCDSLITLVTEEEASKEGIAGNDMLCGLYGRSKRDADSKECVVIHCHTN